MFECKGRVKLHINQINVQIIYVLKHILIVSIVTNRLEAVKRYCEACMTVKKKCIFANTYTLLICIRTRIFGK